MSRQIKCPMCGNAFDKQQGRSACAGCPFGRDCRMLCCPNCGYETVGESRLGALLRKVQESIRGTDRKG
jgi:uncharacterized protein (DUF2225 family)